VRINEAREVYRRVATEGAMLYFLIIALCIIDHMYQYSLESFQTFFFKAIDNTEASEDEEKRVLSLRENIRQTIYRWVSRGLFERHKLIFLTQVTFRLMQKGLLETAYDPLMMNFLLKCPLKTDTEKPGSLDWLPDTSWFAVQKLVDIEEFQQFSQHLEKDAPTRFKDWYNDLKPEELPLPLEWKKLEPGSFKKMLILRCLRPDRLTNAVSLFIRENLPNGPVYVDMD
jgi:dynein heavy chain